MNANSVVILRSNPISPDPRVEKTAHALSAADWLVTVVGWDRSASLPRTERQADALIWRIPIKANYANGIRNFFPLVIWNAFLSWWLFRHRYSYSHIHACDFDTVLPAFLMKVCCGKKVIYDVFDFFADVHVGLPEPLRWLIRKVDLYLISRVDAVIIVDEARKKQLAGSKPKRVEVIYNSPEDLFDELVLQKNELAERSDQNSSSFRIAFVGVLAPTRGLMEMLWVLERHPEWVMELAGFGGHDASPIIEKARSLPNVIFHGRVSYEQSLAINARANLLFAIYDPSVPNHRYSSANKLFEAMMLGKPIIVAHGTSMDDIVNEHQIGFVISYGDVEKLEQICAQIAGWDSKKRTQFAQHARHIYHLYYDQKSMRKKLQRLYASLV